MQVAIPLPFSAR